MGQHEMIFLGEHREILNSIRYAQRHSLRELVKTLVEINFKPLFFSQAREELKSLLWSSVELKEKGLKWPNWCLNLTNDWNKRLPDLKATDIQKRH